MSSVEVRQIGHVAVAPVVETLSVKGHSQTKVVLTVISNASWYLGVGSKVAVDGTLENRRYTNKEGKEVFTFEFTARSVQYLETKAQARRERAVASSDQSSPTTAAKSSGSRASKTGA